MPKKQPTIFGLKKFQIETERKSIDNKGNIVKTKLIIVEDEKVAKDGVLPFQCEFCLKCIKTKNALASHKLYCKNVKAVESRKLKELTTEKSRIFVMNSMSKPVPKSVTERPVRLSVASSTKITSNEEKKKI